MTPPTASAPPTFASLGLMALRATGAEPGAETAVLGLTVDSREVRDGWLFVAVPGTRLDGADFIQYAVRQGAAGVIATPEGAAKGAADLGRALPVPVFLTETPRAELARLAALVHPGQPETLAAVTGTNGKTSVAHFLQAIWAMSDVRAAALGTIGVTGEGFARPLAHTTPDPVTLHTVLSELAEAGCTHAVMEASSHGLAQNRVDGVRLSAAGFTNITRDHLDYHADFADYLAAKTRLFTEVLPVGGTAVIHLDDPAGPGIALAAADGGRRVIRVGSGPDADLRLIHQALDADGQRITVVFEGVAHDFRLPLIGAFQAENALVAAALAIGTGTAPTDVWAALPCLRGVRGRMERVARRACGAQVIVDYSHTPGALETALAAVRPHCAGRLVVVGGAGGDRDPGKRPMMGRAMAEGADIVIVTDDNPRSEDPALIRKAVLAGAREAIEIGDRAEAILAGVDMLEEAGDCLLIAGKGHETGQEVAGQIHPFDDAEQARAAVAALDGPDAQPGGAP